MRTTIIPAQITTIEDKIAGNLGVSQLLLLTAPIFGGSAFFVIFPPFFGYSVYKVVLIVCLMAACGVFAIRFKGMILLRWLLILTSYALRPRYFLFDKGDDYLRELPGADLAESTPSVNEPVIAPRPILPHLAPADLARMEDIMANPGSRLQFKTNRKGELRVYAAEIHT